ncbi:hypothetical protein ASF90_08050 [Xanthomonas sp. Leaf148]|nr:hypothetical protein ASF90_08050 [Xanthomonas sp. Leaf148]
MSRCSPGSAPARQASHLHAVNLCCPFASQLQPLMRRCRPGNAPARQAMHLHAVSLHCPFDSAALRERA